MTQFEKRLAAVEARVGASGGQTFRVLVPPSGCDDLAAWKAAGLAEAERDGVPNVIIVQFMSPGDVPPGGIVH